MLWTMSQLGETQPGLQPRFGGKVIDGGGRKEW